MRIGDFMNWADVEIGLRDAAVDANVRPSRRMIANACLGVGLEDAYYSVRELREAINRIHDGEIKARRRLAEILANGCDDFQRCIYYALAGRGVIAMLEDLVWLEGLLKVRGGFGATALANGGRIMPLVNPYVASEPDGPLPAIADFNLGPSWYLDPDLAL